MEPITLGVVIGFGSGFSVASILYLLLRIVESSKGVDCP